MTTRSFPVTFAAMMSPYLIWAAHFGIVYGINGLACARALDRISLAGFPFVPALVTVATLLALALTVLVLVRALLGGGPASHVGSTDARLFMRWLTAASAASTLVAILWVGLPAVQVPACG
ncbi:hypothetical protein [Azospirillum sp. SYSU D00513]|uniref:hypothetical protein n=1 Tax=Azospirillum sp. SYSU D00513 TaxID=2812561 RepID=UPI001A96EF35|nr:hypothetical protein [Azospirillum sp. SYSU D00513]